MLERREHIHVHKSLRCHSLRDNKEQPCYERSRDRIRVACQSLIFLLIVFPSTENDWMENDSYIIGIVTSSLDGSLQVSIQLLLVVQVINHPGLVRKFLLTILQIRFPCWTHTSMDFCLLRSALSMMIRARTKEAGSYWASSMLLLTCSHNLSWISFPTWSINSKNGLNTWRARF